MYLHASIHPSIYQVKRFRTQVKRFTNAPGSSRSNIEMEYTILVRVSPSSGEADHIETVPAIIDYWGLDGVGVV